MNIMEILGNLGFDWRMALSSLVNFLIIFWLLKKFAFGPIQEAIDKRDKKIKEGLENAEKAASEMTMAEENYKKKMDEAKKEANELIAKASEQGNVMIKEAEEKAKAKSTEIIEETKKIIEKEKAKMLNEVKQETVDIAISITEKILKEKLDKDTDKKIISQLQK